jgi:peptide/nickel transport system substrate-binding protein
MGEIEMEMERFVATSQRQKRQPNGAARWLVLIVVVFASNAITARAQNTSGPQRGGTLIYSEPQPVNSFMPVLSPASILDDEVEVLLYRPLLWIGQKVTIEMDRSIADAISVSGNNTVFTVGMRHNYVWSDGMPVTANDVAYCFNLIKTYGTKYAYYGIGGLPTLVKSFKVLSPYSFSITLSKSVNPDWFKLNGLAQLRPLPAHAWKKYSITYLFNHQTDPPVLSVVDGPYKLTKFVTGQYARFDRNPMYSGHKSYLDTYIVQFYTSDQSQFAALRTGAVQIGDLPFALFNAAGQLSRLPTYDLSVFQFHWIVLNYRNPATSFFRDVKVRQAMQLAIDQPLMNSLLYHAHANAAYSPVPFVPDTYVSPHAKATQNARHFDLAKANAILDADGWKMVNGVRQKNGQKLAWTLQLIGNGLTDVKQGSIIQQDFAKIGIDLKLRSITDSILFGEFGHKGIEWDGISIFWIYYPNFYPIGAGLFDTTGGANFGSFGDPKMDALINDAQVAPGLKGVFAYQDYASQVVPCLYLDQPTTIIKYQPNVHGVTNFFNPVFAYSPEYLWLSH